MGLEVGIAFRGLSDRVMEWEGRNGMEAAAAAIAAVGQGRAGLVDDTGT